MPSLWTVHNDQTRERNFAGLGHVLIHLDPKSGWAVDINGVRAWSSYRAKPEHIALDIEEKVRAWNYLNTFALKGASI